MTFAIHPASIRQPFEDALARLDRAQVADAIWGRRLDVWTSDTSVQALIGNRLGWLDAPATAGAHLARLAALSRSVRNDGLTDVVLLGMGGSSLAADVLRAVDGPAPGHPRFRVLDSIDPDAVRAAMAHAATSLFVVASKSGSTVEVASLAAEADVRVRAAGVQDPGSRFVAVTDANTSLQRLATERGYRGVFVNPADIGGRYSALSLFGLVPAALMGIDLEPLVASATSMAEACRATDPRRNPGLALGAFMAAGALSGRDKLTLVLPDRLERLGLWIEQLVAESTGKHGKGVVPIAGEPAGARPGDDWVIVATTFGVERTSAADAAEVPRVTIAMPAAASLGAEFFRWEFATAAAGLLLDVNPFDEPNVQQAKDATRTLLAVHQSTGSLPERECDLDVDGVQLTLSASARTALDGHGPLEFLRVLRAGDYFGLLPYLPPESSEFHPLLTRFRRAVRERTGCATMLGYGPRYLHSTGQLHKGGPNTGAFLIVTAAAAADLPVPEQAYSFGVLELAQADGDFAALDGASRRVLHVHLPARDPLLLQQLMDRLLAAFQNG